MISDIINGLFECLGSIFIAFSIYKLHREKQVRGISWIHSLYFLTWGFWNLYYYPNLGQSWSYYGGIGIAITNSVYFAQLVYWTRHEKRKAFRDILSKM